MLEINSIVMNRYKILNVAGKGGMGRVYHALDIEDHSHWAIKEDLTDDFGMQLDEEADVLMALDHPALPKTRGVQSWQGSRYMIMQFMEGVTLADKLKQQEKFPEQQVRNWFFQICDVLRYLHSRPKPIVYRDLKPSNIIVDDRDQVKIIDFGIAEEYSNQDDSAQMQKGGLTKGYAAPEQYNRRFKADVRTDIYALGVTIHYLLTGKSPTKPPFEFAPVRKLSPEISLAMESIVKRCLQPNPDKRYESAEALYYDLTHIKEIDTQIRRAKRKRIMKVAAFCLILLCGLWFWESAVQKNQQNKMDSYYALIDEAITEADQKNYSDAVLLLEEAIAIQPKEITGYLEIATIYLLQNEYDFCLDYVGTVILDKFPDCYNNMDFLELMAHLYEESGVPENALFYYRERCNLAPDVPEYWLDLTNCLIKVGKYEEAQTMLHRFLEAGGNPSLYGEIEKEISCLINSRAA